MANSASGALAIEHDLRGQCFGTVSACAAGAHAVGTAARMISLRRRHRLRHGRRGIRDDTAGNGCLRRDGRDLRVGHLPPLRPPPRRLRDGRGGRGDGSRGRRDRRAARRPDPRIRGRLRRHRRRAPHDGAGAERRRRSPRDSQGAGRRGDRARRHRLRQRPRHLDPAQRPLGDRGAEDGARRAGVQGSRSRRPSPRSGICSARREPSRRSRRCRRCAPSRRRRHSTTRSRTRASTSITSRARRRRWR